MFKYIYNHFMKSAKAKDKEEIVHDFAKAWRTLNPELIISNLDKSFKYDSMWVLESLDYEGYKDYIREKFKAIKNSSSSPEVTIVPDPHLGGSMISLKQGDGDPIFYRIDVKEGKVTKGDLCAF